MRRRRILALPAAAAFAAALAGCGTGVTAQKLNASVAPTFEHLYGWKQSLEGAYKQPLHTKARCHRTSSATHYKGAGSDWICIVSFDVAGPNTRGHFKWDVQARPDGCWVADDVPYQLGGQTILDRREQRVSDPIFDVDGCFTAQ